MGIPLQLNNFNVLPTKFCGENIFCLELVLHCFGNGFGCIPDGLNGLVCGLFDFFLAWADHHAHDSAGQHTDSDPTHKTTAFHCITPCVV